MLSFPEDWHTFLTALPEDAQLQRMSDEDLAGAYNLHPDFFSQHLPAALMRWRESPSQSAIGILNFIGDQNAENGKAVFPSILDQTRTIAALIVAGALRLSQVRSLTKDKRIIRTADAAASTLDEDGRLAFTQAAKGFLVWERRNRARAIAGVVKPPKLLFRGLRGRDIQIGDIESQRSEIPYHSQCQIHLARRALLLSAPLMDVAHSAVLSFTATRTIAEYFTGDEGFVLAIEPNNYDVVSAWCLDEHLAGADPVTGRQEREWIVRIRPGFVVDRSNLTDRDRTLAFATRDPNGIEMLYHDYRARYVLEGRRVEASFSYNANGRGGRIYYSVDDGYHDTRRTMKAKTGFDPVPGPGREAADLVYFSQDRWNSKRKNIPRFEIPSIL